MLSTVLIVALLSTTGWLRSQLTRIVDKENADISDEIVLWVLVGQFLYQ
jgi:hypothetical protein